MDKLELLDKVRYNFYNAEKPDITDRSGMGNTSGCIWYTPNDFVIGVITKIKEIKTQGFGFDDNEAWESVDYVYTITGYNCEIYGENSLKKV